MPPLVQLIQNHQQDIHRRQNDGCSGWNCLSSGTQFGIILTIAAVVLIVAYLYWRFKLKDIVKNKESAQSSSRSARLELARRLHTTLLHLLQLRRLDRHLVRPNQINLAGHQQHSLPSRMGMAPLPTNTIQICMVLLTTKAHRMVGKRQQTPLRPTVPICQGRTHQPRGHLIPGNLSKNRDREATWV
ncbi:hypothetical protein VTJ04DRAFT_3811 [Mycothermus thermophilus]|uniref:uncharacterized protein n=1 Tax=Humicola insolens TaxID=85995 RepID=UPI003741ED1B